MKKIFKHGIVGILFLVVFYFGLMTFNTYDAWLGMFIIFADIVSTSYYIIKQISK